MMSRGKHCDVYSLETSLENTFYDVVTMLSLKIILITTNDVKLPIQRHVSSSNLEENDSQK